MKHFLKKQNLTIKGAGGGKSPPTPPPAVVAQYPAVLAPPSMGGMDTIQSFSYAEMIDLLSDGPIEGLVNKDGRKVYDDEVFEGIYLNDTPVKETSNLKSTILRIDKVISALNTFWKQSPILYNDKTSYTIPLNQLGDETLINISTLTYLSDVKIDIYSPSSSLTNFVSDMNASFDYVQLIQRSFDLAPFQAEKPFLSKITLPSIKIKILKSKFDKTEGVISTIDSKIYDLSKIGDSPLQFRINNLADFVYFSIGSDSLTSFNSFEIPRSFAENSVKTSSNKKTFIKNLISDDGTWLTYEVTNLRLFIWSVYNTETGIKNIDFVLNKYLTNLFVVQNDISLYNFSMIQSELKLGNEVQTPLKNFDDVEIDTFYNKELTGPFKLTNAFTPGDALAGGSAGGVQRIKSFQKTLNTCPLVNVSLQNETSDDIRYVKSWPVEYDKNGNIYMICNLTTNYSLFDRTSATRVEQCAIPLTHYIENQNVCNVYVTIGVNSLWDTNHIDLVGINPPNIFNGNKVKQTNTTPNNWISYSCFPGNTNIVNNNIKTLYFLIAGNAWNDGYVVDANTNAAALGENLYNIWNNSTFYYNAISSVNGLGSVFSNITSLVNNNGTANGVYNFSNAGLISYMFPTLFSSKVDSFKINSYVSDIPNLDKRLKLINDNGNYVYCFGLNSKECLLATNVVAATVGAGAIGSNYLNEINRFNSVSGVKLYGASVQYTSIKEENSRRRAIVAYKVNSLIPWTLIFKSTHIVSNSSGTFILKDVNGYIDINFPTLYPNIYKYVIQPLFFEKNLTTSVGNFYYKVDIGDLVLIGINGDYLISDPNKFVDSNINGVLKISVLDSLIEEYLFTGESGVGAFSFQETSSNPVIFSSPGVTKSLENILSSYLIQNGNLISYSTVYQFFARSISNFPIYDAAGKAADAIKNFNIATGRTIGSTQYNYEVVTIGGTSTTITDMNIYIPIREKNVIRANDLIVYYDLVLNNVANTTQLLSNQAGYYFKDVVNDPQNTGSAVVCNFSSAMQSIQAGTKLPAIVSIQIETGYDSHEEQIWATNAQYFSYKFDIFGVAMSQALLDLGRKSYDYTYAQDLGRSVIDLRRDAVMQVLPTWLGVNLNFWITYDCNTKVAHMFFEKPVSTGNSVKDYLTQLNCMNNSENIARFDVVRLTKDYETRGRYSNVQYKIFTLAGLFKGNPWEGDNYTEPKNYNGVGYTNFTAGICAVDNELPSRGWGERRHIIDKVLGQDVNADLIPMGHTHEFCVSRRLYHAIATDDRNQYAQVYTAIPSLFWRNRKGGVYMAEESSYDYRPDGDIQMEYYYGNYLICKVSWQMSENNTVTMQRCAEDCLTRIGILKPGMVFHGKYNCAPLQSICSPALGYVPTVVPNMVWKYYGRSGRYEQDGWKTVNAAAAVGRLHHYYFNIFASNYTTLKETNPYENLYANDKGMQIHLPPPLNDNLGKPLRRYVKVTRLSMETLSSLISKSVTLNKVTEIIPHKFSYPFSAIVGTKVDARAFSQIPIRTFTCKLKKVLVPSNYFPINSEGKDARYIYSKDTTQIYVGDWDGLFKHAWTDNPAWVLLDLLINKRYGLGNYIESEQVDIWELYKIARWCDGVDDNGFYHGVPDGLGGIEPRHAFNAHLGDRFNVFDMVNQVASVFRGAVYYMNSLITFSDDRPKPVIGEFNNSDVKDGLFNYTNHKKDDEYTAVEVSFIDAKDNYKPKIEYIEDTEAIRKRGILKKQFNAFGITSRSQARRFGLHFLYQVSKENNSVNFISDTRSLLYKPGDLININDELFNSVKNFGIVKKIEDIDQSTFKIVIDKKLDNKIYEDKEISIYIPIAKPKYEDIYSLSQFIPTQIDFAYINSYFDNDAKFRRIGLNLSNPTENSQATSFTLPTTISFYPSGSLDQITSVQNFAATTTLSIYKNQNDVRRDNVNLSLKYIANYDIDNNVSKYGHWQLNFSTDSHFIKFDVIKDPAVKYQLPHKNYFFEYIDTARAYVCLGVDQYGQNVYACNTVSITDNLILTNKKAFDIINYSEPKISYTDLIQNDRPSIETFYICDYNIESYVNENDKTLNDYTVLHLSKYGLINGKEILKKSIAYNLDSLIVGSPYSLKIRNKDVRTYKINSITENYINEYQISASQYNLGKFDEIDEQGITENLLTTFNTAYAYNSTTTTKTADSLKSPIIQSIKRVKYGSDGDYIEIVWSPVTDATNFKIYLQTPSKQTSNFLTNVGSEIFYNNLYTYKINLYSLFSKDSIEIGTYNVTIMAYTPAINGFAYKFSPESKISITILDY